ncbi:MAG: DUF4388 domain-containing protein, partial [Candidatus Dormibacteraeota bacterium]|nr:DUF4388 domain-containing protein [Candidatus Dormibacteraeota bacterium]
MPLPPAHTKLLDEIAATRDSQRSGAIDVDWNGSRGSIYFVFGQPSHATFAPEGGGELAGNEALERLLLEVPGDAAVGSWRRVMIPEESLRISIDDLYRRFTRRNGAAAAPDAAAPPTPVVPFRLDGFPILPQGTSLWSDAAANVVHLDMLAPRLPDSLIVLTAPESRAVAVVSHGVIVDAVWVSHSLGLLGDDAARALMNTGEGTVSGYALDDDRLLLSLPLLWRASRSITGIHAEWLDTDRMLADFRAQGRSCAILVDGAAEGVALVDAGALVATYTPHRRRPSSSPASLRSLLRTPGARVTIATPSRDTADVPVVDETVADGHALGDVAALGVVAAPSTLDTSPPAVEPVEDDGPVATSA